MSKSGNKFCLVYYYVPEDKDDPEFPNAFGINLAQEEIKLADIKNMFPLEGEYIFRFKYKLNNAVVWMDINDDSKIPLFNSKIMMKATRISWEGRTRTQQQQPVREEVKAQTQQETRRPEPQKQQHQPQPNYTDSDFSLLGGSTHKPTQSNTNQGGFDDINLLATAQPQAKTQQSKSHDHDDLLGGFGHSGGSTGSTSTQQNKKNDLLQFDNLF